MAENDSSEQEGRGTLARAAATVFTVIDGRTGDTKQVKGRGGRVLRAPEPLPHIQRLMQERMPPPDEWW